MSPAQSLDAELIFYATASGVGLLVAVYAMLHGSLRTGRTPDALKPPPAGLNAPVVGTALMTFGTLGYLIAKYSHVATIWTATMALLAGAAGWLGITFLMARWALRGPLTDPHEELEELQGSIATVTRHIGENALGEISYTFRGRHMTSPARSIGGAPIAVDTEVVIDMITNGIADVELWSVIETRL